MRDTKRKIGSFDPVDFVVEFHFINLILDCDHLFYHYKIMKKITVKITYFFDVLEWL